MKCEVQGKGALPADVTEVWCSGLLRSPARESRRAAF